MDLQAMRSSSGAFLVLWVLLHSRAIAEYGHAQSSLRDVVVAAADHHHNDGFAIITEPPPTPHQQGDHGGGIDGHHQHGYTGGSGNVPHIQRHQDGDGVTYDPPTDHHHHDRSGADGDVDGTNDPQIRHHHHHHHHHDGGINEPHIHSHHHDGYDGGKDHQVHDHDNDGVDKEHELGNDEAMASEVLVLDASNFTSTVSEHPFVVVEFYAPWCNFCKRFAPQYEKAASLFRAHEPRVVLAKIDVTTHANEGLADELEIEAIPALKIIEGYGTLVRDYDGPTAVNGDDPDALVSQLKKQLEPASLEITDADQGHWLLQLDSNNSTLNIVGVFSSYECDEFRNFSLVASELRSQYAFWHTLNASFLPSKPSPLPVVRPIIRVFKGFDEGFDDIEDFKPRILKKFLERVSIPYVVLLKKGPPYKEYLSKILAQRDATLAFLFLNTTVENDEMEKEFQWLARKYRPKGVKFLIADTEDGQHALEFYGVKEKGLPCVVLESSNGKKYVLEKAEPSKIGEWFQEYFDGKLPVFHKSEPVPEKNDELVKTVVLDTFDEMVLNSGKNVLVEFYAPWCAHCKSLAPIIHEVAAALQSITDVTIAKYDATANDIKDARFDVRVFPTIYLHSASGKVIPYEGDLDNAEPLIKFINDNKDSSSGTGEVIKEMILENLSVTRRDEL